MCTHPFFILINVVPILFLGYYLSSPTFSIQATVTDGFGQMM